MYWTNVMNVTLKDAETAAAALEILEARLTDGFDCDNNYRRSASAKMRDNMEVVDNTIVLPGPFHDCNARTYAVSCQTSQRRNFHL